MHCEQCRRILEGHGATTAQMVPDSNSHEQLVQHLKQCASCREYADELHIRRLLRTMPLPMPRAAFASEAIATALQHRRPAPNAAPVKTGWIGAAAASIMAVLLTAQLLKPADSHDPLASAPVQASVLKPVAVMFTAPQDIDTATITIRLDSNMAIQGYQEGEPLTWKTSLKAGANKLTLPVLLRHSDQGTVRIELEYSGTQKYLSVPVNMTDKRSTI